MENTVPMHPSRQRKAAFLTVALVLIALSAFGGFAAGRATAPNTPNASVNPPTPVGSNNSDQENTEEENEPTTPPASSGPVFDDDATEVQMGYEVVINTLATKVTGAEYVDSLTDKFGNEVTPSAGKKFLIVSVNFQPRTANGKLDFANNYFLFTEAGVKVPMEMSWKMIQNGAGQEAKEETDEAIAGIATPFDLIYEVSKKADTNYRLVVVDNKENTNYHFVAEIAEVEEQQD